MSSREALKRILSEVQFGDKKYLFIPINALFLLKTTVVVVAEFCYYVIDVVVNSRFLSVAIRMTKTRASTGEESFIVRGGGGGGRMY